ncbi:MAG: protein kinase, partial [Myxococcales bacterium]
MTDPKSIALDQTMVGDALPPVSTALPGGQLVAGRYELLGLIGSGGMGRVYRAHDRELEEDIALKVLQRDLLGSGLARFIQEVKLARRVTHRNVARTFDIGEHQGERFLTMELVEGEALSDLIVRRGGLGQGEALAIGRQVCAGMAAAHAAGVIHRDLKPDNVLMARDGRAVITDFGIARTHLPGALGGAGMTSGKVLGTPAYMAPEQVESRDDIDARADIYAFGELLYEALTGERAWQGDSPFLVATARLLQPPPDPRARRADLPAPLAELVLRCLARDRDQRFASADDLAQGLDAVAASPRQPAATLPTPTAWQVPRREKTVAVLSFRNLGLPEDAYMVEGLVEDLLDVLASVQGLRVRARGPGPAAGDAAEEGRRLGVDVVVEGSVRRVGPAMRVSARLVGAHDGFQIWSARFDRPLSEAFSLNDEVARAI